MQESLIKNHELDIPSSPNPGLEGAELQPGAIYARSFVLGLFNGRLPEPDEDGLYTLWSPYSRWQLIIDPPKPKFTKWGQRKTEEMQENNNVGHFILKRTAGSEIKPENVSNPKPKKAEYGSQINVLIDFFNQNPDREVSAQQIAIEFKINKRVVSTIFKVLSKKGIIELVPQPRNVKEHFYKKVSQIPIPVSESENK